jgi:predicted N-acyltransferase
MNEQINAEFRSQTYHSVADMGESAWETLSAGRPFQSARWYQYGERVMNTCTPVTIVLSLNEKPVARATFWLVRDEPLPVPGWLRAVLGPILQRWPLLICRSPLSNSSGLILPEGPLREQALERITEEARSAAERLHCSFVLFYSIEAEEAKAGWPPGFMILEDPEPGTRMERKWDSIEQYLQTGGRRNRQHYRRSLRGAERAGIRTECRNSVSDIEQALKLIHRVEKEHHSPANPWMRQMLENLPFIGGTCVQSFSGERLVGCGLLLYEGETQLATALGHAQDVPYVYFQVIYTGLQEAFEKRVRWLRWGSGGYAIKRRLGFTMESNNSVLCLGINPVFRSIAGLAAAFF